MDALLNPATGDYILNQTTDSLHNAVYLRLITPLGSYWFDPTFGSRLHELVRQKDLPGVPKLARQYAEQALASILTSHRASSITVTADHVRSGIVLLHITVVDNTGSSVPFTYPVRVI